MSSRYAWTDKTTNVLMTFLERHHRLFHHDRNEGYLAAADCLNSLEQDPLKQRKCNDFKVHSKLQTMYRSEDAKIRESINFATWLENGRFRTVAWRAANIGTCTREEKDFDQQDMPLDESTAFDSAEEDSASVEDVQKTAFSIQIPKNQNTPVEAESGAQMLQLRRRSASSKRLELSFQSKHSEPSELLLSGQEVDTCHGSTGDKFRLMSDLFEDRGFNDKSIGESMATICQLIIDVVGALRKIVVVDEYCWTQMTDTHIWFEELHVLFSAGLGLDDGEVLDNALRRLKVDMKDLRSYIRMLIAVSVQKNVFTSSFPDFPIPGRKWAQKFAEMQMLGDCQREEHQRIERIAQRALLTLSESDEFVQSTRPKKAEYLAYELVKTLTPLLTAYQSHRIDRESGRGRTQILWSHCGELMTDIFTEALKLRTEVNLKESTYEFFWPKAGTIFDTNTMDEEVFQQRTQCSKAEQNDRRLVTMTVLPGVRRITPPTSIRKRKGSRVDGGHKLDLKPWRAEGKVILPALVLRTGDPIA